MSAFTAGRSIPRIGGSCHNPHTWQAAWRSQNVHHFLRERCCPSCGGSGCSFSFRTYPRIGAMQASVSISSLVAKAVEDGLTSPRPKRRRGRAAEEAAERARFNSRNPADDSDFDDSCLSDAVWNKMYKYEEKEFDQLIFNVFRKDKIETQDRKVNVTTAICVRDCPEKAEEIAMWTKHVKPTLSKAPNSKRDANKAKNDLALQMVLAEAVEEMNRYSRTVHEETPLDKKRIKRKKPNSDAKIQSVPG